MLKANQQGDVFNVNSMITDAGGAFVPQRDSINYYDTTIKLYVTVKSRDGSRRN